MFHLAVLALGIEWYGEWVPSKANVADIMTRPERFHELELGLGQRPIAFELILPPLGESWSNLRAWLRSAREMRAPVWLDAWRAAGGAEA